jgi:hypothetical protein
MEYQTRNDMVRVAMQGFGSPHGGRDIPGFPN